MTNSNSYKTITLLLLTLLSFTGFAQPKTTIRASVDRNKILIGEPILLTIRADIPDNEAIRFVYIDTIPHFEFLEKPPIDTTTTDEGTILSQAFKITSFDSGHWVIPSFSISEEVATDTIPVDVGFSPFDPNQPYHDIKDVIDVTAEEEDKYWWKWYAIGAAALLLLLILYLVLRKKKPQPVVVQAPVDPYQEAMQELDKLAKERLEQKQYYSRLADIFRLYVFKKKGIHSLQKTTGDLVMQLKGLSLAKTNYDRLSQVLTLIDFVKFARYIPTAEEGAASFEEIRSSIQSIEQLP